MLKHIKDLKIAGYFVFVCGRGKMKRERLDKIVNKIYNNNNNSYFISVLGDLPKRSYSSIERRLANQK